MNMIRHGIDAPNIVHTNTLACETACKRFQIPGGNSVQ